ncbi:MAG: sugar phosphate isomerase/epimerase, partial [Yaniella sp.]|nr:sugar phosphate isomerase/epimerase [Yaniella sp.]
MAKPEIPVTLSTSSIFSLAPQHVFAMAEDLGYEGVEFLGTHNRWTQNPTKLNELSYRHSMPIHA